MATRKVRFSIRRFILQVVVQSTLVFALFFFGFPKVWRNTVEAGWLAFVVTTLSVHMFMCFFEWFFHRYVLHATMHPILVRFSRAHRNHHGLTPIRLERLNNSSDRYVLNRYPILEPEQFEDSAFPPYALAAFWLLFTIPLLLVQWALPSAPIILGGYTAIAISMIGYEVFHAIEHFRYEWWKNAVEHPRFGFIMKQVYAFHHFHHANISANEAISGFFGLPIADWAFGTYHQPKDLLLQGRIASAKDFAVKPPPRWVHWLDNWAKKREAKIIRQSPPRK